MLYIDNLTHLTKYHIVKKIIVRDSPIYTMHISLYIRMFTFIVLLVLFLIVFLFIENGIFSDDFYEIYDSEDYLRKVRINTNISGDSGENQH